MQIINVLLAKAKIPRQFPDIPVKTEFPDIPWNLWIFQKTGTRHKLQTGCHKTTETKYRNKASDRHTQSYIETWIL